MSQITGTSKKAGVLFGPRNALIFISAFKVNGVETELASGIYFYSLKSSTAILSKGKFVILGGKMK